MPERIYLAGGMHGDWQDAVKAVCPRAEIFDPREFADRNESVGRYGTRDLHYVRRSTIVFGYMSRENPSGVGLAVEIGVGYESGSSVILVLEPNHGSIPDRYLAFMRKVAHVTFDNLEPAIDYLSTYA